ALDDVVAAALSKTPAARPASGGELARAARAALPGEARGPHGGRRRLAALAAAGVIAGVAAAVVLVDGGEENAPARPQLRVGPHVLAAVDTSGRLVSRGSLPGRPATV